jgi:hypothetical protein
MDNLHRDMCDNRDMCVTCHVIPVRDKRDTPLGGVTTVTVTDMVPMVPDPFMGRTVDGGFPSTHTGGQHNGG